MENLRESLLLGMGNPLLDISAVVDKEFLKKYNLEPNNAILAEEKHKPLYRELVEKYNAEYLAGGSVQNTFRIAQWILRTPNVAVFFGCVGVDDFGKILETKARSAGVNVRYQYTDKAATGTCGVLITGTNRSLCANLGAANLFTIDHMHIATNKDYINKAEYFYVSGFFLTVSPPSILEVGEHAVKNNREFLMNLSAPFLTQLFLEPLMSVLPYVDILFGNELEAEAFAKSQNWEITDLKEIGLKIASLPKKNRNRSRIVIITQGHSPVLLIRNGEITEFLVEVLEREKVVDTNGAGDAFVGGFLAQYIQRKSLDICIRCGIWSARHIIQQSGCSFNAEPDFCE